MECLVRVKPINHLLKVQFIVLVITSLFVFSFQGVNAFFVCLYGGSVGLFNTFLLRRHLYAAAKYAKADASKNLGRAYRCIAERWLFTIMLFVIGFLVFEPVELMLITFVVMQVVVLFGNYNRA
ncbi:MAG: ATP synthase subunit I [Gammaproteobacteria bacterium]|nr:ATP synthase subunit I [Gammaproteobacteria bacterium]MDT8371983.1 ATP synthase subunit I [Gammaproteobacteria bacterium]